MTLLERDELLRDAVIEAARMLMAAELRYDRAPDCSKAAPFILERREALQTLRDALFAERRAR